MLYFIWTDKYGFETVVFDRVLGAAEYVKTLKTYRAYEDAEIEMKEIRADDLLEVVWQS